MSTQGPVIPTTEPSEDQPPGLSRGVIVLWLVAIFWAALLVPLYLVATVLRNDTTRFATQTQTVLTDLSSLSTPNPEVQALTEELNQVQASLDEINSAYSAITSTHVNWSAVMATVGNYDLNQLALTSLAQEGQRVTVEGRASGDAAVIAYSQDLEESGLFSRVVVQSIKSLATPFATAPGPGPTATPPGPTVTPTATLTPTITPTPTPDPSDEHEVDDFTARAIFFDQSQLHNFYPVYDVDKVKFLAKAGRTYRVVTSDLAPGVDTFLTVKVGGTTYTNDDVEAGDLVSEVQFRAPSNRDVEVTVKVTNRGEYGPDRWYQITVQEVVPTPTPTPTGTPPPTPTPTFTPSPTPTPTTTPPPTAVPTGTPTPTPDLRDPYEPDDADPQPLAIADPQIHNFYPEDDVDQVTFLAKAGRHYRIYTFGLTPGVDTLLTVNVAGNTYTNDDRGPGDLSSEVIFHVQADRDTSALVTITNRGQFGADQKYTLLVVEVIPTATPTPTSSPTPSATPTSPPSPTLQPTPEPTSSSSSIPRPPGVAAPNGAVYPAVRRLQASSVEFVIVLELRPGSP